MKLVYEVSTVGDGDMRDEKNLEKFLLRHGLDIKNLVRLNQVHGSEIKPVGQADRGKVLEADGLVTCDHGVILSVLTADCVPLALVGDDKFGMIHVSRHNVGSIVAKAIDIMGPSVRVIIGPCIKKESFVFENRDSLDESWDRFVEKKARGYHIDLVGRVVIELQGAGVPLRDIKESEVDTGKDKNYFSNYRSRHAGNVVGRFVSIFCMAAS